MAVKQTFSNRAWAMLFARGVLGLIFFMAGIYKVFELGPGGHVRRFFLPYQDTFLPTWSLWAVGATIPFVELIAGALLIVGWRRPHSSLGYRPPALEAIQVAIGLT